MKENEKMEERTRKMKMMDEGIKKTREQKSQDSEYIELLCTEEKGSTIKPLPIYLYQQT